MNTILHTPEGARPMHELIEEQAEAYSILDDEKFIRWEALRERCNTIGARDAMEQAIRREEP